MYCHMTTLAKLKFLLSNYELPLGSLKLGNEILTQLCEPMWETKNIQIKISHLKFLNHFFAQLFDVILHTKVGSMA